uniref:Rab-GAP TBC domain-containing protein n=1 Tax=Romanomermis culicivorax TaxID=13658 RepID=A0A915I4T6_ROMCU
MAAFHSRTAVSHTRIAASDPQAAAFYLQMAATRMWTAGFTCGWDMGPSDFLPTNNNDRKDNETYGDVISIKSKLSSIFLVSSTPSREKRRRSMAELLNDLYDTSNAGTLNNFFFADGSSSRSVSIETDSANDDHTMMKFTLNNRSATAARYSKQNLQKYDIDSIRKVIVQLKICVSKQNQLLVCYLKRKDHQMHRLQAKCDMVTAILQALSPKRSVDAKLQFTPDPLTCESGYAQWLNGMKAVARLPDGIPEHFRQKLWITLADHYVKTQQINWDDIKRWAFNDRMNPDDDELSLQIVKDLHRTGWSGLDGDKERIILRRVLLAYARYNKSIGYCQGFNVIVALILEITGYNEEQAFKVNRTTFKMQFMSKMP